MAISKMIPLLSLQQKITDRLVQAGIPRGRAQLEAEILCEADLCGVPSHGVRMLPSLLAAIDDGRVVAAPTIRIEREVGATCVMDCGNGPGRYSAVQALKVSVKKAKQFGIGVCLAKNTSHWGRAHAYATRGAQNGCITLCTTNAMQTMAIGGAKTKVIGNNPLAIGIPQANTDEPVVLDIAMSQAAVGKVNTWLREGRDIPANWGVDAAGNPSQDAKDILQGAVTPMGEHKGAGLAVMFELMTAALAGAAFTQQIHALDQSGVDANASKIFIALDVAAFIEPSIFVDKVSELLCYLADAATPFQFPGERGWQYKRNQMKNGIDLHPEIIAELQSSGVLI